MQTYEYGDRNADAVLLQPVDGHDLSGMEKEAAALRGLTNRAFRLIAVKTERWNRDLSPWTAPPVFGSEAFGDGAARTLERLLTLCGDRTNTYYLGGYSLAGLFALWAAWRTDAFAGVAAASPSLWFPGFADYMRAGKIRTPAVSLSLGDREEKTRNPVMATVGDRVREACAYLREQGVACWLEWHPGNHFREPDLRTAKAFARLLNGGMDPPGRGDAPQSQHLEQTKQQEGFYR